MGWGHLKILFLRTMKPEMLNFTWMLSDMEQRQVDYIMGPRGSNGNEMHIIFLHGPRLLRWAMWPMGLLFAHNFVCICPICNLHGCPKLIHFHMF
jgi:hypothetical protein